MQQNSKKSIFFDKRDANYIKLRSPVYFYEIFVRKKIKSTISIPQTIIFNKGNPKLWLFNSRSNNQVLKKNSDKLNLTEVARQMCGIKNTEEFRIDSLSTLLEVVKRMNADDNIVFIRFSGETKKAMTRVEMVKTLLESKDKMASIIQSFVPQNSKGSELYYVEYRHDDLNLPVNYRYFKKSTITKSKESHKAKIKLSDLQSESGINPFQDLLDPSKSQSQNAQFALLKELSKDAQPEKMTEIFKFVDQRINGIFQSNFKQLVEFLEKAYRIKVKKAVGKFMLDLVQNPYFMGFTELYVEIPLSAPYDLIHFKEDLKDSSNCTFEQFQMLCKLYLQRAAGKKAFQIPEVIYEDEKEISKKLFKNLIVEKCSGDFCDYVMVEKNRGPLAIRKNVQEDYKKHFGEKQEIESALSVTLPHEISYQLILRTRECALEVIELLRKNKIFAKNSNHHYTNEEYVQDFDANIEYPFSNFKREVYNLGNLYRNVKICKNCFIVYSLSSKYFDNRLKGDLKNKQWRTNTATFQSTVSKRNLNGKFSSSSTLPRMPLTAPSGTYDQVPEYFTTSKVNVKVQNIEESELKQEPKQVAHQSVSQQQVADIPQSQLANIPHSISQDHQRFRIMRKTDPKVYKLFMPQKAEYLPPTGPQTAPVSKRIQTSKFKNSSAALNQTRKQMEVIRIAMGFLNYEEKNQEKNITESIQVTNTQSKMQLSIQQNSKSTQIRKPLQLVESRALQDFQQDKSKMKKQCLNETEMKIKLKEYYQLKSGEEATLIYIGPTSIYSYHSNFQHLRQLPSDRITTPVQAFIDMKQVNTQWLKDLDLKGVCRLTQTPYPPMSIPDEYLGQVNYFVFDQVTSVPYLILKSEIMGQKQPKPDQGLYIQSCNQVIVFAGDLFDSSFEYLEIFSDIQKNTQNTSIILLNFPGQAYSVFDETKIYDNLVLCELVDRLLWELDEKGVIQAYCDTFKFLGVGFGGFVFQTFLCFACNNIPFIQSILLVNSFAEVDSMLRDTLQKSAEVFQTCPPDMQELSYNYYSVISNSRQLGELETKNKMSFNPISQEGRICLINSALTSHSSSQQFAQLSIEVNIVHSLKNCVVSLAQTDIMQKTQEDVYKDIREKLLIKKRTRNTNQRSLQLIDGGHSIIDENQKLLHNIFIDFIKADQLDIEY